MDEGVNEWVEPSDELGRLRQELAEARAQQSFLTSILQHVVDGITVQDVSGRLVYANDEAARMCGYPSAEALVAAPAGEVLQQFELLDETGGPFPLERMPARVALQGLEPPQETVVRFRVRATGEERWSIGKASTITAPDGARLAVNMWHDITSLKRTQLQLETTAGHLEDQGEILSTVQRIGQLLVGELDLQRLVQAVTDAATQLVGAEFGSFFYNMVGAEGESYTLYTLSGAPPEAFQGFPMPRNTKIFSPTFHGEGVVRSDDITADPRYGQNPPYHGMPPGHLPVRSYLAVPVISRAAEVVGGLFFGHSQPAVFTERAEQIVRGIAAQTAVAVDNARLFEALQRERKRLEISEDNYRMLAEAIPQMVWTTDADGDVDYANQRWCEYTGLSLEETRASGWRAAIYPDDYERTVRRWQDSVATGMIYEIVYRVRRADGVYRWHIGRGLPLHDEQGAIVRWFGTCTDIDDQKRSTERLQFLAEASALLGTSLDYEQTLHSLTELVTPRLADWCGIYLVDGADRPRPLIVRHRDSAKIQLAEELFRRYPADPSSSTGLMQVIHTGMPVWIGEISEATLQRMARDEEHLRLLRALELRSLMIVPLQARGVTLGALSMALSDPTRRYTEEDCAFAEELGRRAAMAMENAQLYRETQRALHARDQFFSIAAHELKTPLTSILGYTQLLQRRAERSETSPQERRTLQAIVDQVRRLHRLSLGLLDLSRIQEGTLALELGQVDIARLLQRIIDDLGPILERHSVDLNLLAAPAPISGDELRLEQVFQNLIQNAIKYSPDGGSIDIALDQEEGYLSVSIRDQGIGIPAHALPRLFERYFRADNVNASHIGGMGLGLYIVKEIIGLHGGTISASSVEGSGSLFVVRLPLDARPPGGVDLAPAGAPLVEQA